ncbi:Uncharacterised protein [Klebsiella pneumoniae]|uniref:Uncharacterized protein n=1 Tax=Klebsiella pneumoniae TaxID=573 RepID=A0A4P0XZX1_KLEPN|nr:Uncharacterised protein [Klebsiella pneumoniae]
MKNKNYSVECDDESFVSKDVQALINNGLEFLDKGTRRVGSLQAEIFDCQFLDSG